MDIPAGAEIFASYGRRYWRDRRFLSDRPPTGA
jgi:hypothetical protein